MAPWARYLLASSFIFTVKHANESEPLTVFVFPRVFLCYLAIARLAKTPGRLINATKALNTPGMVPNNAGQTHQHCDEAPI